MSKNKRTRKKLFAKRQPDTHKGDYGRVFILAGSEGMYGAAILCSRGALRVGAGLVYLAIPARSLDSINVATPEVIAVKGDNLNEIIETALAADAIAVGPGLGQRKHLGRELLRELGKKGYSRPVVVDADGLTAFEDEIHSLKGLLPKLIITPHPGELGRLLKKGSKEIQQERGRYAAAVARQLNCVVVLKGHQTVIVSGRGEQQVNKTGNPGMATAGSGDVLTGLIAGLAAQGRSPWDASTAGVYLHGLAGDLAARDKGEAGLIASDIIEQIPYAIQKNI